MLGASTGAAADRELLEHRALKRELGYQEAENTQFEIRQRIRAKGERRASSACAIQCAYRQRLSRRHVIALRVQRRVCSRCALCIQALVRGRQTRVRVRRMGTSAVVVQKHVRGLLGRKRNAYLVANISRHAEATRRRDGMMSKRRWTMAKCTPMASTHLDISKLRSMGAGTCAVALGTTRTVRWAVRVWTPRALIPVHTVPDVLYS